MSRRPVHTPPGFTVIELLAATALASLLMALVLGVVANFSVRHRVTQRDQALPWSDQLRSQLHWDLHHARSIRVLPQGVQLEGFGASDWVTGQPTHRPAQILYYLKPMGSERHLWRRERHLDELPPGNVRDELVCTGLSAFSIQQRGAPEGTAVEMLPETVFVHVADRAGAPILHEELACRD